MLNDIEEFKKNNKVTSQSSNSKKCNNILGLHFLICYLNIINLKNTLSVKYSKF